MLPQVGDITTFLQTLQGLTDAFMIMFSTPDNFTFGLMGLKNLWQGFSLVANALMLVFLIVGVMQIMIGRSTGKNTAMTLQSLITKCVIQVIGINTSFLLVQTLVNVENMLCSSALTFTVAIAGNQVPQNGGNVVPMLLQIVLGNLGNANTPALILALIAIVFVVVLFVVFFQSVTRLLHLNLFLVLSPLAFPFLMIEQTREYGSFILKTLVITIYVQFLQVLAFCMTLLLLNFAFAGGAFASPIMKLIMVIGQLVAVASIPRLLTRLGLPSGGGDLNTALGTVKSKVSSSVDKLITKSVSRKGSRPGKRSGRSDQQNGNAGKRGGQSGQQNGSTVRQGVRPMGQGTRSAKQSSSGEQGRADGRSGQQGGSGASERRRPASRGGLRPISSGSQGSGTRNDESSPGRVTGYRTRKIGGGSSSRGNQDSGRSAMGNQDNGRSATDNQGNARARWRATGSSASRRSRGRRGRIRRSR